MGCSGYLEINCFDLCSPRRRFYVFIYLFCPYLQRQLEAMIGRHSRTEKHKHANVCTDSHSMTHNVLST